MNTICFVGLQLVCIFLKAPRTSSFEEKYDDFRQKTIMKNGKNAVLSFTIGIWASGYINVVASNPHLLSWRHKLRTKHILMTVIMGLEQVSGKGDFPRMSIWGDGEGGGGGGGGGRALAGIVAPA